MLTLRRHPAEPERRGAAFARAAAAPISSFGDVAPAPWADGVPQPPGTRWRASPFVRASVALHGAAAVALALWPQAWAWVLGALVLDHALIVGAGLWPRSTLLGPNLRRLPEPAARAGLVALTIDDGPDPVLTPQVLDALAARGARATFFCVGARAQAHPSLVRRIVAAGHDVQNHSHDHRHHFSLRSRAALQVEVAQSQQALAAAAGSVPRFFRAPAGLRNVFLDRVLHDAGLRLTSWTRRGFDTRERDPARVVARLTRGLAAGDILLLHDANAARSAAGRPVVLDALPALLDAIAAAGLRTATLTEAMAVPPAPASPRLPRRPAPRR